MPLGGTAGERVAVLEMVARVGERHLAGDAVAGTQREGVLADCADHRAGPVANAETCVVLSAEDAVADPELVPAELDRLRAEPAGAEHPHVRGVVEVADVGAPVGEHHRLFEVVLGGLPPVFKQPLLGSGRIVCDLEAAAAGGVSEVGLGIAVAHLGECLAFDRLVLAAVVKEFERAESFAEGGVEAAGADSGQLGRVADQN